MSTTVHSKYSLVFLLFTTSFVLATFTQIENQLITVSTDAANWENVISLFPNGVNDTLIGAEDVHQSAEVFNQSLSTIADTTAATGPLNLANGTAVLNIVLKCGKNLEDALSNLIIEKPSFQALPVPGFRQLIFDDLVDLNTTSMAFADAFIANAPAPLLPNATAIKESVADAFATAIAAYS